LTYHSVVPTAVPSLSESATDYLRGKPARWLSFADAAAGTLLERCTLAKSKYSSRELRREIAMLLLEPALLFSVAAADSDNALLLVCESICSFVNTVTVELSGAEIPLDARFHLVRPTAPRNWSRWVNIFAVPREFSRMRVLVALKEVGGSVTTVPADVEIFQLSIIDHALYKTLATHPELMQTLNWRTFECLLADILERFGYEIELCRGSKDGGVDLIAVKPKDILGPERYLLQAKRWVNSVGVEPVRQLLFLQGHERATKACLATTARFTRGAWELADQYRWQLHLRDHDGLLEWIRVLAQTAPPA
jgi:hypothetical protein